MAWFLKFDGVNDYLTSPLSHTFSGVIVYETVLIPAAGESIYNCHVHFNTGGRGVGINQTQYSIRVAGVYQLQNFDSPLPLDEPSKIRLEIDTATDIMRCFVNDVEQASSGFVLNDPVTSISDFIIGSRSAVTSSSPWAGDVTYAKLSDATGDLINLSVDASARGAGATIITDTVAGNNATGFGFPTDGSQYFEIATGASIVATITEQGPSFSETISATVTGQIQATITELAPSFSESITANVTPSDSIEATITESGPSFSEVINALISGNIGADITEQGPSFSESIQASISISISADITESGPSFTESITVKLPTKWTDKPKAVTDWDDKAKVSTTWTDVV